MIGRERDRMRLRRKVAEVAMRDLRVQWVEESITRDLLFLRALSLVSSAVLRHDDHAALQLANRLLVYNGCTVSLSPAEMIFMQNVAVDSRGTIKTWLCVKSEARGTTVVHRLSRSLLTGREGRPGLHARLRQVGLRIKSGRGLVDERGRSVRVEVRS